MNRIVLFDQELQYYRQNIYKRFSKEFSKIGYSLVVYFDKKLNKLESDSLFHAISYDIFSFKRSVLAEKPTIIIQFVWLRYKFILPFMLWAKFKRIKIIVWSHGINLQNKNQRIKNLLYYIRQNLANAVIIYNPEQKQFFKVSPKKLFIANNTIDFDALPKITATKDELKQKYGYENMKVILSVGRFNVNNRKVHHLTGLSKLLDDSYQTLVVGPGVSDKDNNEINNLSNIEYKGSIYNQKIICELYKMADLYIMPGAIGLSINQAQYFNTPVILEDVEHGPEGYYLIEGYNGFLYNADDIENLNNKVIEIFDSTNYDTYAKNAKDTCNNLESFDKMLSGFINAIEYVRNR